MFSREKKVRKTEDEPSDLVRGEKRARCQGGRGVSGAKGGLSPSDQRKPAIRVGSRPLSGCEQWVPEDQPRLWP